MILPHGRQLIMFLPMEELYDEFKDHDRLTVFANKGLECVTCPRKGTFLVISKETESYKYSRKRDSVGRLHIDVYTDDFVLMTVDHITPKYVAKQLGWTKEQMEALDNKQPMCENCNGSKGCKTLTNEQLKERRKHTFRIKPATSVTHLLVPNIHRLLGDAV